MKDDLDNLLVKNKETFCSTNWFTGWTSIEYLMLNEKLCLFENANAALLKWISEMSSRIGILECNNKVDEEKPSTSEYDKRKLCIYEEELGDKLKIYESKLVASL